MGCSMADTKRRKHTIDPGHYTVLAPIPPFVDVILQSNQINPQEFAIIEALAMSYPNDPRMVKMVRKAGDASAKVPYLIDYGETSSSILEALREVAEPYVQGLKKLPAPMQATIHTLLSINIVPQGCERYGIPALLEINRIQQEMTDTLRGMMVGRKLAQEFHESDVKALKLLDEKWSKIREKLFAWPFIQSLPEKSQMQFIPKYYEDNLVAMREICVIVDSPYAQELKELTPPVLQNPLPFDEPAPVTGSADWLLRVVGKVGRHFTRAMLEIINRHLEEERIHPSSHDFDRINYEAQEALRLFDERNP